LWTDPELTPTDSALSSSTRVRMENGVMGRIGYIVMRIYLVVA